MATTNKFNHIKETPWLGFHDLSSDQLRVAFTNTAPAAEDEDITDIIEISYTDCGSRDLTISSATQSGGTFKCLVDDLEIDVTGAVGPLQYAVIYNATTGKLMFWIDYGAPVTVNPPDKIKLLFDQVNGLFDTV